MRRDGVGLWLRLLGELLGWRGLAGARLGKTGMRCDAGVLFAEVLKHIFGDAGTERTGGGLGFRVDFRHFRGKLLAQRRTVKLQ
jgi:hypothetical protein